MKEQILPNSLKVLTLMNVLLSGVVGACGVTLVCNLLRVSLFVLYTRYFSHTSMERFIVH